MCRWIEFKSENVCLIQLELNDLECHAIFTSKNNATRMHHVILIFQENLFLLLQANLVWDLSSEYWGHAIKGYSRHLRINKQLGFQWRWSFGWWQDNTLRCCEWFCMRVNKNLFIARWMLMVFSALNKLNFLDLKWFFWTNSLVLSNFFTSYLKIIEAEMPHLILGRDKHLT